MKHIAPILFLTACSHLCFAPRTQARIPGPETAHAVIHGHASDSLKLSKGIGFIEKQLFDSARHYLLQSAGSNDLSIRTESYLYLNFIETRIKNYDAALVYLEQYHKNAMQIYRRAVEAEKRSGSQNRDMEGLINKIETQNKLKLLILGIVSFTLLAVVLTLVYLQYKKLFFFSKSKRKELKNLDTKIEVRNQEMQQIEFSAYLLEADVFSKTPIFLELKNLEAQPKNSKASVLGYAKQEQLQKEIDRTFANFNKQLQETGSNLTQNDLKLCCLSLLPLSSFGKALSFGSTEISVVKQRKHYIKKKMAGSLKNQALFNFIFAPREQDGRQ